MPSSSFSSSSSSPSATVKSSLWSLHLISICHVAILVTQLILATSPILFPMKSYQAWIPRIALCACWFYWAAAEMLFRTTKGANTPAAATSQHDQGTTFYNAAALVGMHFISIMLFLYQGAGAHAHVLPLSFSQFHTDFSWYLLPLICIVVGTSLRFLAMSTLRDFFSRSLTVFAEHRVVDAGIYQYVRHPGYLANGLVLISTSLLISCNVVVALFCLITFVIVWDWRMNAEEKMMLNATQTKQSYQQYIKRVPSRLVPGIY